MPRSRRNSRRSNGSWSSPRRRGTSGRGVGYRSCALTLVDGRLLRRLVHPAAAVVTISTISFRMLNSLSANEFCKFGSVSGPVGPDRLLDQVVEQLLDERRVGLLAPGQEIRPARGRR